MSCNPLPVILSCPHAGMDVPHQVRDRLIVSSRDLSNDSDLWADDHYNFDHEDLLPFVPQGYAPGTLANITMPISRALIDVNRYPHDLDNPDGPVKSRTSYGKSLYAGSLDKELQFRLLEQYWWGYHQALNHALQLHAGRAKLLLDCHSMAQVGPSAYSDPGTPRPLICLSNMGDEQGCSLAEVKRTSCEPWLIRAAAEIAMELFEDMQLLEPIANVEVPVVAINRPFRGGYIIREYSQPGFVTGLPPYLTGPFPPPAILIEVNRGLFIGNQSADREIGPANQERIAEIRRRLYIWAVRTVALI